MSDPPAPSFFEKPIVKAAPGLLGLFVLVKAYAVAGYSLTTTGALITAAPLTVLLGSIASYLYIVFPAIAIVALVWLLHQRKRSGAHSGPVIHAAVFLVLVMGVLLSPASVQPLIDVEAPPWPLVFLLLSALLLYLALRIFDQRLFPLQWLLGLVVLTVVVMPTLPKVWVPAEVLVLRGAGVPVDPRLEGLPQLPRTRYPVVYVLSSSDGWMSVMHADTRYFAQIRASDVVGRVICHHRDQLRGAGTLYQELKREEYSSLNVLCSRMVADPATRVDPFVIEAGPVTGQGT